MLVSLAEWNSSLRQTDLDIEFVESADRKFPIQCDNCIKIVRESLVDSHKRFGEFRPIKQDREGYITAAEIAFETRINGLDHLTSLLSHEIGHGMGLWDCYSCKSQSTVMNLDKVFRRNMALTPTLCDMATVVSGYSRQPSLNHPAMVVSDALDEKTEDEIFGPEGVVESQSPPEIELTAEDMAEIQSVLSNEEEMRDVLKNYSFKRDVLIQTVDEKGNVSGEFHRISQLIFDDQGRRIERVLSFPKPDLKKLKITKEDVEDLAGAQPFGPETGRLGEYRFVPAGVETVDGKDLRIFKIYPKDLAAAIRSRTRMFVGTIWTAMDSHEIVQMRGKSVPEGKQRFPTFETYRSVSLENRLLPSRTFADETLHFPSAKIHIRMTITYSDYKIFKATLKIVDVDVDADLEKPPGR
jgi:hypothetical protein